jgi:chromate transporter
MLRGMAIVAFIAIFAFNIPFPIIIIVAGLFAYIGSRFAPDSFKAGGHHGGSGEGSYGEAIIDDDTPAPEHVRFKWSRVLSFLAVGLVLGFGVMGYLYGQYGWDGTLTQMGYFFTKAALLTIGGAYAVLPYISLGGVEQGWIDKTQMLDGLALGETTPGPLVMVNAFVGFVGGWTNEIFGTGSQLLSGIVAASVVTFFTFLPSFLFIFLGGPVIEATRNDLKFTAPLTGITAAVVGVILNLGVFFAYHVLWPNGFTASFADVLSKMDWVALIIGLIAFIALIRFKIGVVTVIASSALLGLAYYLLVL